MKRKDIWKARFMAGFMALTLVLTDSSMLALAADVSGNEAVADEYSQNEETDDEDADATKKSEAEDSEDTSADDEKESDNNDTSDEDVNDDTESSSDEEDSDDENVSDNDEDSVSDNNAVSDNDAEEETVSDNGADEDTTADEDTVSDNDADEETVSDNDISEESLSAESDFEWNGNTITKYTGSAANVVIPARATEISQNVFKSNKTITSLSFESGSQMKKIGYSAFYSCTNLTSVSFPEGLTEIGGYAFYSCDIKEVTIPSTVTTIGSSAFSTNKNLTEVKIDSINITSKNTNIFDGCNISSLTLNEDITAIPDKLFSYADFAAGFTFEIPSKVKTIGYGAFNGCKNLTAVTLPEGLLKIEDCAFQNCGLQEITIPSTVTAIKYEAFNSNTSLTKVNIKSAKIVEAGALIFDGCNISSLTLNENITAIPNNLFSGADFAAGFTFEIPSKVKTIGEGAFNGCKNLSAVTLPEGLLSIGDNAFNSCSLQEITIPSTVTTIKYGAFNNNKNLATVIINSTRITETGSYIFDNCNISSLTFNENITTIPKGLFFSAKFVSGFELVIPSKVKTIEYNAFAYCSNISSVTLPEGLTKIENGAFNSCGLQEVTIPSKVTEIGYTAFGNNKYLTKVIIPASVKIIGYSAFGNCPNAYFYVVAKSYAEKYLNDNKLADRIVISYAIKYVLNGGSLTGAETVYSNKDVVTFAEPVRQGYTFAGWFTDSKFTPAKSIESTYGKTGALTIYAKWTPITYSISYELNGGKAPADRNGKLLNPETYALNKATSFKNPTREKYTFDGWYLSSDFSGAKITTFKVNNYYGGDVTLYAKWVPYYNVLKFNLSGAKDENNRPLPAIANMNSYFEGADSPYAPAVLPNPGIRYGYTFEGWNTNSKGTGTSYAAGDEYTAAITKNKAVVTLYAIWKPITYSITYELNDKGSTRADNSVNEDPGSASHIKSMDITKAIVFKNPTRNGYTFKGWYEDEALTKPVKNISKKYYAGGITIYAKWELNKFTVTYNANGAKGVTVPQDPNVYNQDNIVSEFVFGEIKNNATGEPLQMNHEYPDIKPGYTFCGWSPDPKAKDGASPGTHLPAYYSDKSKLTLYAAWCPIGYLITYELNGGTNSQLNPATHNVTAAVTLKNPTKPGYVFGGWYSKSDCTSAKVTTIAKTNYTDVTLYAKWTPCKFNVTFDLNGGKSFDKTVTNPVKNIDFEKGSFNTPNDKAVRKNGYKLVGWTYVKDAEVVVFEPGKEITGNDIIGKLTTNNVTIKLYAKWEKIEGADTPNNGKWVYNCLGSGDCTYTYDSKGFLTGVKCTNDYSIYTLAIKNNGYTYISYDFSGYANSDSPTALTYHETGTYDAYGNLITKKIDKFIKGLNQSYGNPHTVTYKNTYNANGDILNTTVSSSVAYPGEKVSKTENWAYTYSTETGILKEKIRTGGTGHVSYDNGEWSGNLGTTILYKQGSNTNSISYGNIYDENGNLIWANGFQLNYNYQSDGRTIKDISLITYYEDYYEEDNNEDDTIVNIYSYSDTFSFEIPENPLDGTKLTAKDESEYSSKDIIYFCDSSKAFDFTVIGPMFETF